MSARCVHQNYCISNVCTLCPSKLLLHVHCPPFPPSSQSVSFLSISLWPTDKLLPFPHRCVLAEGLHFLHHISVLSLCVLLSSLSLHPSCVGQGNKALPLHSVVPKALNHFAFCKINFHPSVAPFLFFLFLSFYFYNVLNLFLSSFNKIKRKLNIYATYLFFVLTSYKDHTFLSLIFHISEKLFPVFYSLFWLNLIPHG